MTKRHETEAVMTGMDDLDDLFAAARKAAPVPPADLVARVLEDARQAQPRPVAPLRAAPVRGGGLWGALAGLFGGGGVLAGMGTAAVAGLFMGFAMPDQVLALTDVLASSADAAAIEMVPGIDALIAEE